MQADFDIGNLGYQALIYLFIAIFVGISQAAGIGGGPIINICLIIGLGVGTKKSMAITYIILIGGSIASIYSNYGKKLGTKSKYLIDSNLFIITLPMTVSGSIFGALLNHYASQLIITILFTILLSYLAYSSFKKYLDTRVTPIKIPLIKNKAIEIQMQNIGEQKPAINPKLQQIMKIQDYQFKSDQISTFVQIIILSVIILLCKGGDSYQSIIGLQKCGLGSYLCILLHFSLSYYYGRQIAIKQYKRDKEKISLGYCFENKSDRMSKKSMHKSMILGFAAGLMGGMLGIGGAIILVPAWLQMGMEKTIASSSSAPLILSSAIISAFIAALCHLYDSIPMIIFYLCLSFIASYYIKEIINRIKIKYQLEGMIFILLVIVMLLSLVFLLPYSFFKMINQPEAFFAFGYLC